MFSTEKIILKFFKRKGMHLGGETDKKCRKSWGTYDGGTRITRYNKPFYYTINMWEKMIEIVNILKILGKSSSVKYFFGSLTCEYNETLNEASGRCGAAFYGDSDKWIYGQYTNFLLPRADFIYLPDIIDNDALYSDFYSSYSPLVGIRTTDSMSNIDFSLFGDSTKHEHVLFYVQLIAYNIIKPRNHLSHTEHLVKDEQWFGFLSIFFLTDLWEKFMQLIKVWPPEQWVKTLIALGLGYYVLFCILRYFHTKHSFWGWLDTKTLWGLYIADIVLNMLVASIILKFKIKSLLAFTLMCPLAYSIFILIAELLVFYAVYWREKKEKDESRNKNKK